MTAIITMAVISAAISAGIASSKGLDVMTYTLWGLFLGVIGIVITAMAEPNK